MAATQQQTESQGGLVARLFSPFMTPSADALHTQRVQVVVLCLVVVLIMTLRGLVNHLISGSWELAAGYGLFALFALSLMIKFKQDKDLNSAAQLAMAMTVCSTVMATAMTGGLRMTNVAPYFALIVGAVLILGRRGLPWVVVVITIPVAFEMASSLGVVFPDRVPEAARRQDAFVTWLSMAIVLAVFTMAYEGARERALVQLHEANRVKSRFLANISHELRTPLQVISATHELLEQDPGGSSKTELLRTARQHSAVLTQLVDDLLDLATTQRGRFDLREEVIDLPALISDVHTTYRALAVGAGLLLRVEVDPQMGRWVQADPRRMRQVLCNLLQNAFKFTTEGTVHLRVDRLRGPESHKIRFSVSDTGIGLSTEEHDRVFGDFYQVDDSLTREAQGAGLGLFIAEEIVSRMGGQIEVESEEGQGSTFWFTVPLPEVPEPTPQEAPLASASDSSLRLLLVEDNDDAREMVRELLEALGHEVHVASNGQQAVEAWHEHAPQIILMDVQMPVMDGLAAARIIRTKEAQQVLDPSAIIAMTGHCTQEDRDQCAEAGMGGFLQKPFRLAALREALDQATRR